LQIRDLLSDEIEASPPIGTRSAAISIIGRRITTGTSDAAVPKYEDGISLCREGPPLVQRGQPSLLVNLSGDEMAFQIEVVSDLIVN